MKKFKTLISLLLLIVFVSGCIFGDDDNKSSSGSNALIGTWKYVKNNAQGQLLQKESVTFTSSGTYKRTWLYMEYTPSASSYVTEDYTEEGLYVVSENIITISFEGGTENKKLFSINGNELTLTNAYDSEEKMVFTKV